ncbi:MAG: histidinol-phosphate transaminase [Acidimicrobiales bacterium]|nr:histidinol-phosphate transaminase [Acidimicrobiales bacterium]
MPEFVQPQARVGVVSMEGYHSPQVDVAVRLNTNESPVPPPEGFRAAVAAVATELSWNRYPDRHATALRSALAEAHGVTPMQVFAANGSNEVLQSLLLAYGGPGRSAAVFEPTYAMYAQIARITGTDVLRGTRDVDHRLVSDDVMALVADEQPALVFLCSPNNPTGTVDPVGLVADLVDVAAGYGGLVVVDEAYGQFASTSAVDLLAEDRPLVVSRTFSKTWAMAGARLGYLLAPTWCVAELDKVVLPYHLDAFKQTVGILALEHRAAMDDRVAQLVAERNRMAAALDVLPVTAWPSEANFILFRPDTRSGRDVWQALVDRSVLVRDFTTMVGIEGCLRVTIGTTDENDRFIEALGQILGGSLAEAPHEPDTEGD